MIKHFHLHLLACTALVAMSGFASLSIGVAHAETAVPAPGQPQPEAEALPPAIPKPLDKPFPGALKLAVDATDLVHHVMSVHETIPVPEEARANGQFIVLYPKWLPGNHSPSGSI